MDRTNLLHAYKAARARFVYDDVVEDGRPCVRVTDPVTGLSLAVRKDEGAFLGQMFRGYWMEEQLKATH